MVENLLKCLPELKDYEEDALLLSTYLVYIVQSTRLPSAFSKIIGNLSVSCLSEEEVVNTISVPNHGVTQHTQVILVTIGRDRKKPTRHVLLLKIQILKSDTEYRKISIEYIDGQVLYTKGGLNGKEKMVEGILKLATDKKGKKT